MMPKVGQRWRYVYNPESGFVGEVVGAFASDPVCQMKVLTATGLYKERLGHVYTSCDTSIGQFYAYLEGQEAPK